MVLTKMKETAESFLGHSVTKAVVTVPAYFNGAMLHPSATAQTSQASTSFLHSVFCVLKCHACTRVPQTLRSRRPKTQDESLALRSFAF